MTILSGVAGSPGYARGYVVIMHSGTAKPARFAIADPATEVLRLRAAQQQYAQRLEQLYRDSLSELGEEAAEIFKAYQTILADEAFFGKAIERTTDEKINIEFAIDVEYSQAAQMFEELDDPYLLERLTDIKNVCGELTGILSGAQGSDIAFPKELDDVILVASDLTPAQTMRLEKSRLRGFVTEKGGVTSHTVILAKVLGIPAIVGVSDATTVITDGVLLQMDAFKGQITLDPDLGQREKFSLCLDQERQQQALYREAAMLPAVTIDGFRVDVNINSGDSESLAAFDPALCDGIGLLRTEFLYLSRNAPPSEEEQFEIYRDIAQRACGQEVIVHTLDIGGDKQAAYLGLPAEDNPFLGYRAIRICLDQPELFLVQLRAILRASAFGNVKIMFPMIVTLEELEAALALLAQAKAFLREQALPFNEDIKVGIMIETPAAVLLSADLARKVDFFSIGSNDLIQYVTASDRLNERVSHLYDSCNISVLRCIRMVSESAAAAGIPWGICGEVASETLLLPLWLAMGVCELSVAPTQVGIIKHRIGQMDRNALSLQLDSLLENPYISRLRGALGKIV